jgi:hypothetical protein
MNELLIDHLQDQYGIGISALTPLDQGGLMARCDRRPRAGRAPTALRLTPRYELAEAIADRARRPR